MAAVGFVLLTVGAMLIYAGMTGDSLPGAVRDVVQGKDSGGSFGGFAGGGEWGGGAGTEQAAPPTAAPPKQATPPKQAAPPKSYSDPAG